MKTRTTNRHTPAEPKPTNEEQRASKQRYEILAASPTNAALWRVKQAAEELESLIEDFEDIEERDLTELHLANLGLEDDGSLSHWGTDVRQDMIGFKWALHLFIGAIEPLGKRPSDLDEAEAEEPAIVTT